ncbi:carbohydrate sulfotransferase 11 [Condylostylus longicornis]|uniref:carbohydrate sulfotransferase 11 n=1 Tax=Condylostylus longicornis TaxID=2530218 RepID=UPI00244E0FED|nr:carbohydrate sulfotransferase 11 [Condylostylus longicornis]XP_055385691.1 carbohydrate sulfotransferase 11 [Condylostylus longicornis]XP_055385692.1 carbohydrate sulfotransferase 11 [Condylostylus longicornis]XP_055385693.1 carbohydrate sulfotransferase 11 [Condylostylus longicornis]
MKIKILLGIFMRFGLIVTFYKIFGLAGENNNKVRIRKHGLELTQNFNIQRQEHLQRMCKTVGHNSNTIAELSTEQMEHMLIDHNHKLLYCYVPKVACTNWKRMLMMLTYQWKYGHNALEIPASLVHSTGMFTKLNSLNINERKDVLFNYTRFVVVRHPFERLLSAYRNKLEGTSASAKYFQLRVGKQIVLNLRARPTNESLEYGNDVTFEEFVQYLLRSDLSKSNMTFNEHWEPIANLCKPCTINYNIIGKYETLLDDSALVLDVIGANENLTFPAGHKSSGTKESLKKYFDAIPVALVRKLYELYRDDFKLFDYRLEHVLGFELG